MTDIVPFQPSDDRSYNQQMRDALEQALEIHGTVINDLNQAMNVIIQMERALGMVGAPNPYAAVALELKKKYGMGQYKTSSDEWQKQQKQLEGMKALVEGNPEPLELTAEVVEWCDDCQKPVDRCLCPW